MAITLSGTAITMNDSSTIVSTSTYGAIGSYAVLNNSQSSSITPGSTIAGSSLVYVTASTQALPAFGIPYNYNGATNVWAAMFGTTGGNPGGLTAQAGTWRNMSNMGLGGAVTQEGTLNRVPGLFARTA